MTRAIAICIGCGCDDLHACYDPETEAGCYWLRVDYERGIGVCSACDDFNLEAWDMGDFTLRAEPRALADEPVPTASCNCRVGPMNPRCAPTQHNFCPHCASCSLCGMTLIRHAFMECP